MKKRIALYGIDGLYNLGCEAIVKGISIFLDSIDINCEITYYSKNYNDDKKILKGTNIRIDEIKQTNIFLKRVINKLLRVFHIDYCISFENNNKIIKNNDIVFSIGGDIYTIPKHIRDKQSGIYKNALVDFGEKVLKKGKKLVIYGASIGPFGNNIDTINYYCNHLKKVDLIVVREENTIRYLNSINVKDNVVMLPDPAFSLRQNCYKYNGNSKIIGLNISPCSLMNYNGKITEDAEKSICSLIINIIETTKYKVMLLPHVFSKDYFDNDKLFMEKIVSLLPKKYIDSIEISNSNDFLSVKKDIVKCEMIIAARMHCAVNALSEGIPTILLSYSSKSVGMCEFVYNNSEWVENIDSINSKELIAKIEKMLNQRTKINIEVTNNLNQKLYSNNSYELSELKKVFE